MDLNDVPEDFTAEELKEYMLTPRVILGTAGLGLGLGVVLGFFMTLALCSMCALHWEDIRCCGGGEEEDGEDGVLRPLPGRGSPRGEPTPRHSRAASQVVKVIATEDLDNLLKEKKGAHDRKVLWFAISLLIVSVVTGAVAVFQTLLDFQEQALEVGLSDASTFVSDSAALLCETAAQYEMGQATTCSAGSVVATTREINDTLYRNLTEVVAAATDLREFRDIGNTISSEADAVLPNVTTYSDAVDVVSAEEPTCKAALEAADPSYNTSACDLAALVRPSIYRERLNDVQTGMDSLRLGIADIESSVDAQVVVVGATAITSEFDTTADAVIAEALAQHLRVLSFHDKIVDWETKTNRFVDHNGYYFLGFLVMPGVLYVIGLIFGCLCLSPKALALPISYSYFSILPLCAIASAVLLAGMLLKDGCDPDVHFTLAENVLQDEVFVIEDVVIHSDSAVRPLAECGADTEPTSPDNNFVDILGIEALFDMNETSVAVLQNALSGIAEDLDREAGTMDALTASLFIPPANESNLCVDATARVAAEPGCSTFADAVEAADARAVEVETELRQLNGSVTLGAESLRNRSESLDPFAVDLIGNMSDIIVNETRDTWRCGFVSSRYNSLVLGTYCKDVEYTLGVAAIPLLLLCIGSFFAFVVMIVYLPTYVGDTEYRAVAQEVRRRRKEEELDAKLRAEGSAANGLRRRRIGRMQPVPT